MAKYNGWHNYETWIVHLWLTNESGTYNAFLDLARAAMTEENPVQHLSAVIKEELEEGNPLANDASEYADLLNAALSEVNWYEVAEAFIEEVKDHA